MEFKTNTTNLKEALQRLGFAVVTKSANILPVLGNILATVSDEHVLLTTSDLQTTISYSILCETSGTGQFLIPFAHLKNIVALEDGDLTISFEEVKGVTLKFEKDVFCLGNAGDVKDFPKTPKVADSRMFEVTNEFVDALKTASVSTGKDELRPAMCCICVEFNKESLVIVSTDSHGLYTQTINGAIDIDEPTEVLIPVVIAKVLEGFFTPKIGFNKTNMAFESGPISIITRRSEGKFPNWRAVVPPHEANVFVNMDELKDAANKAYVISDQTNNGIDFFISANELQIKTSVLDTGMNCDIKIPATATAAFSEANQIRFNGRLLKRMLTQLEGSTGISLCITGPNKAATVRVDGKDNATALLMPITITN